MVSLSVNNPDASKGSSVVKILSKWVKNFAPSNGMVDNQLLFKSGYGHFVSLLCQACFLGTFIYSAISNTHELQSRKYLSPIGEENSGAICTVEPIEISGTYTIDQNGFWDTTKNFNFSQGIYSLELKDVKFADGQESFQTQIETFAESFKSIAMKSYERDYAWNMVFASSYSDTSFDNDGVSKFSMNADARIIYKPEGSMEGSGITNGDGLCVIDGVDYVYNEGLGSFVMDIPSDTHYPQCGLTFIGVSFLEKDLTFDAATISTALAVNMGITSLDSLSKLFVDFDDKFMDVDYYEDSVNYFDYFTVYVDSNYAPMQPIYCLDVPLWLSFSNRTVEEVGWDETIDNLCLLKIGDGYAMPLTNSAGNSVRQNDSTPYYDPTYYERYSFCFEPLEQCTLETATAKSYCFEKAVMVSLLFYDVEDAFHYTGLDKGFRFMIDLIVAGRLNNPENPDLGLMTLTYPVMSASRSALFFQPLNYWEPCKNFSQEQLVEIMDDFCDGECSLLTFFTSGDVGGTIAINGGNYPYSHVAFDNAWYDDGVLINMEQSPVHLTEKYQECQDSFQSAFTTALSNAFASAGLYTSVLLMVLLAILIQSHNRFYPKDKLYSPEKVEANVRNSTVEALKMLAAKSNLNAKEAVVLQKLLNKIILEDDEDSEDECDSNGDIDQNTVMPQDDPYAAHTFDVLAVGVTPPPDDADTDAGGDIPPADEFGV